MLPKQSPWLLGTILDGSPLRHRIPASWHSFCRPQKDDRQSQPHVELIQQLSRIRTQDPGIPSPPPERLSQHQAYAGIRSGLKGVTSCCYFIKCSAQSVWYWCIMPNVLGYVETGFKIIPPFCVLFYISLIPPAFIF